MGCRQPGVVSGGPAGPEFPGCRRVGGTGMDAAPGRVGRVLAHRPVAAAPTRGRPRAHRGPPCALAPDVPLLRRLRRRGGAFRAPPGHGVPHLPPPRIPQDLTRGDSPGDPRCADSAWSLPPSPTRLLFRPRGVRGSRREPGGRRMPGSPGGIRGPGARHPVFRQPAVALPGLPHGGVHSLVRWRQAPQPGRRTGRTLGGSPPMPCPPSHPRTASPGL